jgi:phosphosulfolactate synthase
MINQILPFIPERTTAPRNNGLTMVMDKGLSLSEASAFVDVSAQYTDLLKLGFGTALVTPKLSEKIKIYHDAGLKVYFGGTLFEAFIARNMFDDYCKLVDKFKVQMIEVSDGSIVLDHNEKCEYIHKLSKNFTVLSEVGSKDSGILISPAKWIKMMKTEIEAGSWKVIAEGRESGTVGIFRPSGHAHTVLVNKIIASVKSENIMWEAPKKEQQVWFIKYFGANVNLGNIAPHEVIAMECLRLGLRGDTFFNFMPKEIVNKIKQKAPKAKK